MPGDAALVCAVEEGDSVYFHWNEVPSKNTNDQETVFIDLICTVAVEKRSRSEKEYVDMRQTRAMVALDISDTSEKEYVDMRETRAMAALDISNTSEKGKLLYH
ncbi:UNVERIFIED_CONTAM: hypothetical protein FKN15_029547 [Acipenser sinensis]